MHTVFKVSISVVVAILLLTSCSLQKSTSETTTNGIINIEEAKKMNSILKRSTFIQFDESGHVPFLEEPERFISILQL